MESSRNRNKNMGGSISSLLNPSHGVRDDMKRRGVQPKDHMRENAKQIRQAEMKNRMRKEDEEFEASRNNRFTMQKFANAESKIAKDIKEAQQKHSDAASTNTKGTFLRKNTGAVTSRAVPAEPSVAPTERKRELTRPPVPSRHDAPPTLPAKDVNYIQQNARENVTMKPPSQHEEQNDPRTREDYGKVPEYLKTRKHEMSEAARRKREAEEDDTPVGMRLLPEEEKESTLKALQENQSRLSKELANLPLMVDTVGLRRKKTQLEAKLNEIEEAIALFSRPKVYVEI